MTEQWNRAPTIDEVGFGELLQLEPHGPDTYVGIAAKYPWGPRLFGGQVVAQALAAAIATVAPDRRTHSLHSYFIRPGSVKEPIRFEVERLRDGRSFCTRQVVARQSAGAILNVSVSFQVDEDEADVQVAHFPEGLAMPDDPSLVNHSWGAMIDRRVVDVVGADGATTQMGYWLRINSDHSAALGDDPINHTLAMAYMSDAAPSRAARAAHPEFADDVSDRTRFIGASLDHSIWFHRDSRADQWHWFDTRSHGLHGARGLVTGDVLTLDGVHVATIAQEVLLRRTRDQH